MYLSPGVVKQFKVAFVGYAHRIRLRARPSRRLRAVMRATLPRLGMGVGLGRGMGMGKGLGGGAGSGAIGAPIARLFANLIVMGGGVLGRHFMQAYKEALASAHLRSARAHRTGGPPLLVLMSSVLRLPLADGGKAAAGAATKKVRHTGMPEAEARLILNLPAKTTDEEISEVRGACACHTFRPVVSRAPALPSVWR